MFALPPLTPAVRATLVILVATFVAQTVLEGLMRVPVFETLAIQSSLGLPLVWQVPFYPLVDYPISDAVLARLISLFFIYLWTAPFELEFGPRRTAALMILSALGGGVAIALAGLVMPHHPVAGPGALSWGAIGAMCIQSRGRPLNLVFLPAMSGWGIATVLFVIQVFQALWSHEISALALALGGFGVGVLFTRSIVGGGPKPRGGQRPQSRAKLHAIRGGKSEGPAWLN
jgi:hypothetical protein